MNNKQIRAKLVEAQNLLADVYGDACDFGIDQIERLLSCADDCIIESLDALDQMEEQAIDDASWRA